MSGPFGRPRVHRVTVEIEGYDGQLIRLTYHDTFPDQQPDASTGIELELETVSERASRQDRMRHVHRLRIDNSPTYTVQHVPPAQPARTSSERATPAELPAATPALEDRAGR